jgi:hypothetical protein
MATAAKSAPAKAAPPLPVEVEQLAKEYRKLEKKIAGIAKKASDQSAPHRKRLDELWDQLLGQVREFGSVHAEKSKLLYGVKLEVMATFKSSTAIDAAAVENFRLALVEADQPRVLSHVFEKSIHWTLLPEAATFLRKEHDEGNFPDSLFVLYARCSVPKEISPTLVVRERTKAA